MWETLMRTTQATGNEKLVNAINGALVNASHGTDGRFVKDSLAALFNQWNDDLGGFICSSIINITNLNH
jgi:hypothetical protein